MQNLTSLALKYQTGKLLVLDQRLLPQVETWVHCRSPDEMYQIIKTLQVRGAPLIGIAAALSLADFALSGADEYDIKKAAQKLQRSRPTAVNLKVALDRLVFENEDLSPQNLADKAVALFLEDVQLCDQMSVLGSALVEDGDSLLTYCNTGSLVTAGKGTALGVIKQAWKEGKKIHVFVSETRPLLQGARLTAWELEREGIPYTLICDNTAAHLMSQGRINKVLVGSDRIALNGDVANKIGTYNVAIIARHHNIPFYVVAPYTTIDIRCESGSEIPIEERGAAEVRGFASVAEESQSICWAPPSASIFNPAFDVTPVDLITAIVLDRGVYFQNQLTQGALKAMPCPGVQAQ